MNLVKSFKCNIKNIPGWLTKRKIVVIESDDWGSIRMPSRVVFDKLTKAGLDLISGDSSRYNHYDSLATADDLTSLFDTLSSVKDANGNPCIFTAISVVANPDFEKIRSSDFLTFFYESFTETLKRYPNCNGSFLLWREGIQKGIFVPQFHGREHLNVSAWLRSLRAGHTHTRLAFDHAMWGFIPPLENNIRGSFQAAFDIEDPIELSVQETVIKEGLQLFETIFGYPASYFVPPNGPFNRQLERVAADNGIRFIAASKIQREPLGNGHTQKTFHWLGQKNRYRQRYVTRNCFFEPSENSRDWISSCLNDIQIAFNWHKPAIISSHRVNYIGALDPRNREKGLKQLKILLNRILNKWPDVEFLSTNELGLLMVEAA